MQNFYKPIRIILVCAALICTVLVCIAQISTKSLEAQGNKLTSDKDSKPDSFLSNPLALSVEVQEILLENNSVLSIHKNKPFRIKVPKNVQEESYKIITDNKGEVHLLGFDSDAEEPVCESYLFRRSKLWGVFGSKAVLEQCSRKSNYFQCQALEGTIAFKNCSEHVTETGDAVVIEMGTWYTVSYYPEIDMTLTVVLDGNVQIAPKINSDGSALGPFTTLEVGQIWLSQPKGVLKDLNIDLYGQVFEITFLPELITRLEKLSLDYPHKNVCNWAKTDNLEFFNNKDCLSNANFKDNRLYRIALEELFDKKSTTSPE